MLYSFVRVLSPLECEKVVLSLIETKESSATTQGVEALKLLPDDAEDGLGFLYWLVASVSRIGKGAGESQSYTDTAGAGTETIVPVQARSSEIGADSLAHGVSDNMPHELKACVKAALTSDEWKKFVDVLDSLNNGKTSHKEAIETVKPLLKSRPELMDKFASWNPAAAPLPPGEMPGAIRADTSGHGLGVVSCVASMISALAAELDDEGRTTWWLPVSRFINIHTPPPAEKEHAVRAAASSVPIEQLGLQERRLVALEVSAGEIRCSK